MQEEKEMLVRISIIKSNARKLRSGLYNENYHCIVCGTSIGQRKIKNKNHPLEAILTLQCQGCRAKEKSRIQSSFEIIKKIFYGG